MKVPFDQYNLGFYKYDDFSSYLRVSPRCVRGWIEKGSANNKYAEKINFMHQYCQFPIDIPPFPESIISKTAFRAFKAIKEGNTEFAELITSKALYNTSGLDWKSAKKTKLNHLQEIYCKLANALSWIRHPDKSCRKEGLRQLLALRREIKLSSQRKQNTQEANITGNPWSYAYMMTSVRAIAYIGIIKTEDLKKNTFYTKNLHKAIRKLREYISIYPKSNLCALINWNGIQIASINDDEALFIMGLDSLHQIYKSNFKNIIVKLKSDKDTALMLDRERIKKHYLELMKTNNIKDK